MCVLHRLLYVKRLLNYIMPLLYLTVCFLFSIFLSFTSFCFFFSTTTKKWIWNLSFSLHILAFCVLKWHRTIERLTNRMAMMMTATTTTETVARRRSRLIFAQRSCIPPICVSSFGVIRVSGCCIWTLNMHAFNCKNHSFSCSISALFCRFAFVFIAFMWFTLLAESDPLHCLNARVWENRYGSPIKCVKSRAKASAVAARLRARGKDARRLAYKYLLLFYVCFYNYYLIFGVHIAQTHAPSADT